MAARVITELKSGAKRQPISITARNRISLCCIKRKRWSRSTGPGSFRGSPKTMEIFPEEGLLIFTSLRGIIYNSNLIPKDKAPKTYEDLVDPV